MILPGDSWRTGGAGQRRPLPTPSRRQLMAVAAPLALAAGLIISSPPTEAANTNAHTHAGKQAMQIGPGPATAQLLAGRYRVALRLTPNRASRTGLVTVSLSLRGQPISGARLQLNVRMLDMNMGNFTLPLHQTGPGHYSQIFPVVGMDGHWQLQLQITPTGTTSQITKSVIDRMRG